MLYSPSPTIATFQNNFSATPSLTAAGTTVTSGAAYTKGAAFTQLIASTTYESYGFWINIGGTGASATRTDTVMDIAIGAASSEQIIVPNLLCGWRNAFGTNPMSLFIPIYIPKGSRVSARTACATASKAVQKQIILMGGCSGIYGSTYTGCDAYGVTYTAGTVAGGTSHTPGNTGVESTFANLGATATRDYRGALLIPQGSIANTTMTAISYHWELGLGGTTIAEWYTASATTEMVVGPLPGMPIPCAIPTGAQMQVRAEGSGTSIAHDVGLYLFY
jgi:hypothetical protein